MSKSRLGILGGAFDPPHVGHVELARAACAHFSLQSLLVLVVADPGHKATIAPAAARLELARLAFSDLPNAQIELDQHARTVDWLEEHRPRDAVFILGGDELAAFAGWKDPERVLELVTLGVAMRPGVSEAALREARARLSAPERVSLFPMTLQPVSSSDVRASIARAESVDGLVPPEVEDAIERLGLYRAQ
ncbi:MAG: nicotinate-nicotinamide nucleotide adenylyltransferase [Actinobacteria bacterium]|nr:nicotinate-nicotinamide nucleotide adenylyltransferase [Actinomycetota bacterium]